MNELIDLGLRPLWAYLTFLQWSATLCPALTGLGAACVVWLLAHYGWQRLKERRDA